METLTSREAADRLGVAVSTFHNIVTRGELTPIKRLPGIRGALLFAADDVDELCANRAAKAGVA